jgi:MFS family permease
MRAIASERRANPALLALLWLGIQAVWGALLGISLQARSSHLTGASAVEAYGVLAVSGAAVAAVVQIAAGMLSDRHCARGGSRTGFYVFGAAVASCGIAWFYLAADFTQLIAAYAVVQGGMNVAMGAYQAVIPDVVAPKRRGIASAWMAGLQSLGNAVGAICATLLSGIAIGAVLIAVLLATCALTVVHVRDLPRRAAPEEDRVAAPPGALVDLFVSRFLAYLGFYTLLGYLYFFVHDALHVVADATPVTGRLLLIFTVVGAVGATFAARPSDRIDKRIVAAVGGGVFVCAVVSLCFVGSIPAVVMVTAVAGVAWGIFLVADWALGCRAMPPNRAATGMSLWNLAVVLPQMGAPVLATFVVRMPLLAGISSVRTAFFLAGAETAAGILWLMRLPGVLTRE